MPSVTPNTATRSHSRPFTRWIVDSVTPAGSASRWNAAPQPRLEAARVGVQVGDAEQALEVVEVARPLPAAGAVEQAHRRAEADVVAHGLEHVARRAGAARRRRRRARSSTRRSTLRRVLVRHLVGERGELGQRPARAGVAGGRGTTAAGHAVGRRRISTMSSAAMASADVGDAQVGERGAHAGALEHVGPQHRRRPARPASCSATCGASSSELTRASTAIDAGATSGSSSQPRTTVDRARRRRRRGRARRPAAPPGVGSLSGPASICLATRRWL